MDGLTTSTNYYYINGHEIARLYTLASENYLSIASLFLITLRRNVQFHIVRAGIQKF